MNKKPTLYIWIALIAMALSACNDQTVFVGSKSREGSWSRFDTAVFEVEVNDSSRLHDFYINLRHNKNYRYRNIYLFLHTSYPGGQTVHDTIELILADKQGEWIGKGMGSIKENEILLRKNFRFPAEGKYIFAIEQGMRKSALKEGEYLQGIEDIGIRIERSPEQP
ncbi:MAG: gliding motility lipoprotein GldH [Bacteroidales bacterium]|nr:gliding motility lipoprotein GldH [Bacteroidales bacterium]MCF8343023.1 gliding motility lipoprotein GldH [Bacteroidales bacterium]MCF8350263.1 gliding motility lipoprotein GldH [Bacteroidales bacterium]MCF8375995.1 gliding motility lipoprotein GldH [Bacteroidales bacterium]MCF8400483.1 gliding motility lipoprotein GldH [Bacteroidales bacterium]